jgi:hypothetical protein
MTCIYTALLYYYCSFKIINALKVQRDHFFLIQITLDACLISNYYVIGVIFSGQVC